VRPFCSGIPNTDATIDPKILDIYFRIDQGAGLNTLAKHILGPAEGEEQIQAFAKSHGWSVFIHDLDNGRIRAVFRPF
jgi:hypothetical protein